MPLFALKPIILGTFFLLLIASYSLTSNAAERLTWCAYYDGKPWIYPINAKYDGVLIEQLTIFEKNNNIKTTVIEDLPWKRCQREVEIGNIDMVLGAYKTKEREKLFSFSSEPVFTNISKIYAYSAVDNKKAIDIKNLDQLKELSVARVRSDSHGKVVDDFIASLPKNKVKDLNNHKQVIKRVISGQSDYFFYTESQLKLILQKENINISLLKKVFEVEDRAHAYLLFSKRSDKYQKYNDKYMNAVKEYYSQYNLEEQLKYHTARSN
ncbi:substrate-binding periplasmic protein [Vibrio marisflavi]|uniref:Solute-binding protein family 3/N-terminal domain-containing protein n=1 Tax=Vibrio marisflavi CECT 7928 TaxID=634439 RepID=A0ABM9AA39_9VIBR|nr:transporter substrate-binding domain-containing protein [Vibrio marisflavi]CAH0542919.1 hypothetical protein VMF7928_04297 [Vibrio marisflavi CECT 7928]